MIKGLTKSATGVRRKKRAAKRAVAGAKSNEVTTKNKDAYQALLAERRKRFRILVCLDGNDSAYESVKLAAMIGADHDCDIVLLYVRRIDQGLNAGGLQVRVARRNLLEWGLELPGIEHLRRGFDMLMEQNYLGDQWEEHVGHTDVFGDPLGDNKVEYRGENNKSVVLKLKTAADIVSGILHQYELGPYNMIMMGPSIQWKANWRTLFEPNIVQKVAGLVHASVMTVRDAELGGGFLLSTDGSEHSLNAKRQGAVLAHALGQSVKVLGTADDNSELTSLEKRIETFAEGLKKDSIKVDGWEVKVGEATRLTVEAGKSSSVIVVSDKQASRARRFFSGSIAFDVMRLSNASVLNIR